MSDQDLATYNARVASIDDATPFPDVVNVIGIIGEGIRRLRELKAEAEQRAVAYLTAHGEQTINETRYYAGPDRSYKAHDVARTFNALLEATGGDIDAVVNRCLASASLKPGECRKVLDEAGVGERFGELFEVRESWEVKQGKPKAPKLQSVNMAFVK